MSVDINMNPALQATSFAEEISLSDHRHDDKTDKDKEEKDLSSASYTGPSAPEPAPAVSSRQLKQYSIAFAVTTFGIGPAFGCAVQFMTFQMQQIAYFGPGIGYNPGMPKGSGCLSLDLPCLVPFGSRDINLTSVFLYLNAISYGVSGALTLLVCGIGDHFSFKREQYIFGLVAYGALCLPAAGLTAYKLSVFNALAVLYSIFNIIGFLVQAWMNVFVPYTMHHVAPIETLSDSAKDMIAAGHTDDSEEARRLRTVREREGLKMSVWGGNSMNVGLVIFYCITIGLVYTSYKASLYAGLYMTTVAGGICIFTALAGWRFLPTPSSKPYAEETPVWKLPFITISNLFKGIYQYPEAFKFLLAYTIYNDSAFAFGTVVGTLFNNVVRPSLVEYTAYSVVGTVTSIIGATAFLYLFPRLPFTLRHWAIACYALVAFIALWCLLGINKHSPIGFKHRAEFYVFQVLQNIAGSILAPLFRVLFPELFPKGSEIQYFGFQLVLSCSTVWIPQIVDGPIVQATNNQRLPAIIAFVFFLTSTCLVYWMNDASGVATIRREESIYALPADGKEYDRLEHQHRLMMHLFAGPVVAPIQQSLSEHGGKVIDVGCGPGSWIREVRKAYPLIQPFATDFAPTYTSAKEDGVEFEIGNVLQRLPYEDDSFDFVHMRFFTGGLKADEWDIATKELHRITKPGGWVQMTEPDGQLRSAVGITDTIQDWNERGEYRPSFNGMRGSLKKRGGEPLAGLKLKEYLATAGFTDPQEQVVSVPMSSKAGPLGQLMVHDYLSLVETLAPVLSQSWGITREEMVAWGRRVLAECEELQAFHNFVTAYAQKGE